MCPFTQSAETNLALCLIRDPICQLGIVCVHTHTHARSHTHRHSTKVFVFEYSFWRIQFCYSCISNFIFYLNLNMFCACFFYAIFSFGIILYIFYIIKYSWSDTLFSYISTSQTVYFSLWFLVSCFCLSFTLSWWWEPWWMYAGVCVFLSFKSNDSPAIYLPALQLSLDTE